jgi:hypothetical protein
MTYTTDTKLTNLSDQHALTMCIKDLNSYRESIKHVMKRHYTTENTDKLCGLLQNEIWVDIFIKRYAETAFYTIYRKFTAYFNKAFPKTVNKTENEN